MDERGIISSVRCSWWSQVITGDTTVEDEDNKWQTCTPGRGAKLQVWPLIDPHAVRAAARDRSAVHPPLPPPFFVCVTSRLIITDTWSRWMESAANNFGDWSVICWDDRSERERPLFFFDVGCSTIDSLFNQICGRLAFNKRNVVNCILESVNFEKCYLCRESFDYCLHGAVWKLIILTN